MTRAKNSGDEFSNNDKRSKKPSDSSEEGDAGEVSPPAAKQQPMPKPLPSCQPQLAQPQQEVPGRRGSMPPVPENPTVFNHDIKYSDVRLIGRFGAIEVDWVTFHSVIVQMFTPAALSKQMAAPSSKAMPPAASVSRAPQCVPYRPNTQQKLNDTSQGVLPDRQAIAKNFDGKNCDGYKWRKYGQKLLTLSRLHREYLRCTHPGCPARKRVEVVPETREVVLTTSSEHNHPPVLPIFPGKSGSDDAPRRAKRAKKAEA